MERRNTAAHGRQITGNALLDALSAKERSRLPMTEVSLSPGQVLCEYDQQVTWVCFPVSCVISCLRTTREGATVETALVGNDGMFCISVVLAGGRSFARAMVQHGGLAVRVVPRALQSEFASGGELQHTLLRYADALLMQVSQAAVCNRLHTLEQRLCRWLLLCRDRTGSDEIALTQELMGNILGGRRESVAVVAGHLQDLGAIRYARGNVSVLDPPLLEQLACECYELAKARLAATYNAQGVQARHTVATVERAPFRL